MLIGTDLTGRATVRVLLVLQLCNARNTFPFDSSSYSGASKGEHMSRAEASLHREQKSSAMSVLPRPVLRPAQYPRWRCSLLKFKAQPLACCFPARAFLEGPPRFGETMRMHICSCCMLLSPPPIMSSCPSCIWKKDLTS